MIPLARYGTRELLIATALCAALGAGAWWMWPALAVIPGLLWIYVLCFFRNPVRHIPQDAEAVVSPADGTVWDIQEVEETEFIRGRALRIGIFLSVFNVHVNRVPYAGVVKYVRHVPGKFHDARIEACILENEAQWVGLQCDYKGGFKLMVRQVSGWVARRIVCELAPEQSVAKGELYGMIKFGSRTELWIPLDKPFECAVKVGDTVRGGSTVLGRLS